MIIDKAGDLIPFRIDKHALAFSALLEHSYHQRRYIKFKYKTKIKEIPRAQSTYCKYLESYIETKRFLLLKENWRSKWKIVFIENSTMVENTHRNFIAAHHRYTDCLCATNANKVSLACFDTSMKCLLFT